jgi:hypothetical protein
MAQPNTDASDLDFKVPYLESPFPFTKLATLLVGLSKKIKLQISMAQRFDPRESKHLVI